MNNIHPAPSAFSDSAIYRISGRTSSHHHRREAGNNNILTGSSGGCNNMSCFLRRSVFTLQEPGRVVRAAGCT
ncbi:hypothetical protein EYF80_025706 [Liparis tanakae]|uniref:Uncharacterized protein n=1 Tax=Liparis tanakae TaxID=230148 RepID=A0A4Z2HDY3_9TELE|nr:hypothetical protein EYF80_025706 [Liparis tanakae]